MERDQAQRSQQGQIGPVRALADHAEGVSAGFPRRLRAGQQPLP